jgi:hypothetical protein
LPPDELPPWTNFGLRTDLDSVGNNARGETDGAVVRSTSSDPS